MLTSADIYKLVEIETQVKLSTISRKRKYVYARGVANTLCKEFTEDSFGDMGELAGVDHASVMNSIKAFRNTYIHYSKYHREIYMKLREYILEVQLKETKDKRELEKTGEKPKNDVEYIDLTYKYIALQNENELLKYEVRKSKEDYEKERFKENPLVELVDQIPPEKRDAAFIRIEAMVKML